MSQSPHHPPHVFSIPAGVPFLPTFCRALLDGAVLPHFPDLNHPMSLAEAKIYVPTRRAARALARELQQLMPAQTILLPQIVTLGHFEHIETDLIFAPQREDDVDIPPSVSPMQRHLELMRLVHAWAIAVRHERLAAPSRALLSLLSIDAPQAWFLARDLAALMDEMVIEDIDWAALETLVPDQFDDYWRVTLDFLKIATQEWPHYLATHSQLDAVARQKELVAREITRLENAPPAPLIALGSTGTNRSTARLLRAIAYAPQGAIILPGLDMDMDERSWAMLNQPHDGMISGATHPQAALHRLLHFLRIKRQDVRVIGARSPAMTERMQMVSEALRPAESTDAWHDIIAQKSQKPVAAALAPLALIEARDEREEALCLALALREVLQTPDKTAALVTPDRELALRVQAELQRWQIEIDDSGGQSLALTPMGRLARLVLRLSQPQDELADLPLLAHEYVSCGATRAEVEACAHIYELGLLRTLLPDDLSREEQIQAAKNHTQDVHAHPAKKRISAAQWDRFSQFMVRYDDACAPLKAVREAVSLEQWVEAHRAVVMALRDPAIPFGEDDLVLQNMWDELASGSHPSFLLTAQDYDHLCESILATEMVRGPSRAHPRLKILGLLEARLLHVDVAILAGLDENIWPPAVSTDAFLNRPMRAQLGLSPPERRIGQTAHDFVQLMGAPEVILSHALKRNGAPTVPSRFLQRLATIFGESDWKACTQRGHKYQLWAQQIDAPSTTEIERAQQLAQRPAPCPPLDMRPTQLSVTRIETWRRDPYAIYAEKILRLIPLDPIGVHLGGREIGTGIHALIAQFARHYPALAGQDHYAYMHNLAQTLLNAPLANHGYRLFQWPRNWAALQAYIQWEHEQRSAGSTPRVEINGHIDIDLDDGSRFRLTCQADRIDDVSNAIRIVDFKTGRVPTSKQIQAGFAPQLTLEAAIMQAGGFDKVPAQKVTHALYVKLGGPRDIQPLSIESEKIILSDLIDEHFAGLRTLLNQYREADMVYPARPYPQYINEFSPYDHLARVKEWNVLEGGDVE